jgi:hypothetical protein
MSKPPRCPSAALRFAAPLLTAAFLTATVNDQSNGLVYNQNDVANKVHRVVDTLKMQDPPDRS